MVADGNKWIYKNKGVGMMSAAASLGLILLWDVEGGLSEIDKFLYASEDHIKVSECLDCWGAVLVLHSCCSEGAAVDGGLNINTV